MSELNTIQAAADPYRLNRDVLASNRLNLQHYIWKESLGYTLHPSIKLPDSNIFIADVGTGTGWVSPASLAFSTPTDPVGSIWLHDLYRKIPNAQFHGFDISSEQYPAPGFVPPNLSLRHLDILKEIPSEHLEKYDVVHVRLLVQVVNQAGGDPRPVLRNLIKLLSTCGFWRSQ